jgi:hypothetical protein
LARKTAGASAGGGGGLGRYTGSPLRHALKRRTARQ